MEIDVRYVVWVMTTGGLFIPDMFIRSIDRNRSMVGRSCCRWTLQPLELRIRHTILRISGLMQPLISQYAVSGLAYRFMMTYAGGIVFFQQMYPDGDSKTTYKAMMLDGMQTIAQTHTLTMAWDIVCFLPWTLRCVGWSEGLGRWWQHAGHCLHRLPGCLPHDGISHDQGQGLVWATGLPCPVIMQFTRFTQYIHMCFLMSFLDYATPSWVSWQWQERTVGQTLTLTGPKVWSTNEVIKLCEVPFCVVHAGFAESFLMHIMHAADPDIPRRPCPNGMFLVASGAVWQRCGRECGLQRTDAAHNGSCRPCGLSPHKFQQSSHGSWQHDSWKGKHEPSIHCQYQHCWPFAN